MKKLLFMGLPGAGKGTQAELLKEQGFVQISTGDIIRAAIKSHDKIIEPYEETINAGGFLPDEIIFELEEKAVNELPEETPGYILDGAVRTLPQAEFAKEKGLVDEVVFFDLQEETATNRLSIRTVCPNCKKTFGNETICPDCKTELIKRKDDSAETIHRRFVEYNEKTAPVLDFLKENFEFKIIDANSSVDKIHKSTVEALGL